MHMPTISEPDIRKLDARAVRASVDLVAGVTRDDLDRPTPCAGWTLADLLAHMSAQHRGFAAAATGGGADLAVWQPRPADDPVAEYAAARPDAPTSSSPAVTAGYRWAGWNSSTRLPDGSSTRI